jgi:hypothetical protein
MSPFLDQITSLLSPPGNPIGLDRSWNDVETEIGLELPSDYKEFTDLYGSGLVCGLLGVWNFRDSNIFKTPLHRSLCGEGSIVRSYQDHADVSINGASNLPYPLFPDPRGLLPFATVIDVHNLN